MYDFGSCAAVLRSRESHTFHPFVFICKCSLPESSIWFETSVLHHTINNGLSVGLPRDFPLLSCIVKILKFWIHRFIPFSCSNPSQIEWISCSAQSRPYVKPGQCTRADPLGGVSGELTLKARE